MIENEDLDIQKIVVLALYVFILLPSLFILINLVRIYQGRVILIIPMHNVDHPCAYDFDWYDDGGDDADELDGISREHTTWGILSLVGIWVSLVSIFFFSFLFFFFFC